MHLDEDILAMIALGDRDLDDTENAHLEQCEYCARELDAIRHLVTTGRSTAGVVLEDPVADVWKAIHSELALTDAVAPDPLAQSRPAAPDEAAPSSVTAPLGEGTEEKSAPVTALRRARGGSGFTRWWPLAAAALFVGVVLGIVGTQLWTQAGPQVVATATLEPFPNWQATGSAQLADVNGTRELRVELDAPAGGLREVWLIDPSTSGLLSLGFLDGDSGRFSIPADVDLNAYSLVDISAEPGDGNPGHSGDSIVRGELRIS